LLACVCPAIDGLDLVLPEAGDVFRPAVVCGKDQLAPDIYRIRLLPTLPLVYRPGQFINLRRADGLVRSYSIASLPGRDPAIEIHVQRRQGGAMTRWIAESLAVGESVEFDGPTGACFYLPGRPLDPLLLIGTGTGVAPLMGIVGDALMQGHLGPIHLYHGSSSNEGLYCRDLLLNMAARQPRLHLHFCVSRDAPQAFSRAGRAKDIAFAEHPDLTGYRVYLCGAPEMVNSAKKAAYLAGARMQDIHADPFENKDLRTAERL
jgi:ferredoxin-NADP reductase